MPLVPSLPAADTASIPTLTVIQPRYQRPGRPPVTSNLTGTAPVTSYVGVTSRTSVVVEEAARGTSTLGDRAWGTGDYLGRHVPSNDTGDCPQPLRLALGPGFPRKYLVYQAVGTCHPSSCIPTAGGTVRSPLPVLKPKSFLTTPETYPRCLCYSAAAGTTHVVLWRLCSFSCFPEQLCSPLDFLRQSVAPPGDYFRMQRRE